MRLKIYALLLACIGSITTSKANDMQLTIKEALALSADQQIQSQHIARIYLSLCNNMLEPIFYQERDVAIKLFDDQLHKLAFFTPTEDIKYNVDRVKKIWTEYKKIAEWSIKKEAASKLIKLSTGILQATKSLHSAYLEYQYSQTNQQTNSDLLTINEYLKGNIKQLVLVERTMMFYLAEKQGIDVQGSNNLFKESQKIFLRTLNVMDKAEITSASIRQHIAMVRKQWSVLEYHFNDVNKNQEYMKDMFYSTIKILALVKQISRNYKDLAINLNLSYSLNETINQTILVQKISKAYVASSVDEAMSYTYRKQVTDGVAEFENRINSIIHTAQTEGISTAINTVQTMWKNYKRLVTDFENIDEVSTIRVMELGYVVMASCDRVTDEVEAYAQSIPAYTALYTKNGVKVDPSSDITHLTRAANNMVGYSERIALYFMMKSSKIDDDLSSKRLRETITDFEESFEELNTSSLNTSAIQKLLESCMLEWMWVKNACKKAEMDDLKLMLDHIDLLCKKLRKTSVLYEHKMNDMFSQDEQAQQSP